MSGETFVRRFTQHALPKGFRKIRHYGLLAPGNVRRRLPLAFELLGAVPTCSEEAPAEPREPAPDPSWDPCSDELPLARCRSCGQRAVERRALAPVRGPPRVPLRLAS